MVTLIVSDLHLCPSRPQSNQEFFYFLKNIVAKAEALFILGDLFEYWAGDDDLEDPFNAEICAALLESTKSGVPIYYVHGNRDFLISDVFVQATGVQILPDPYFTVLYDTPTLLMHGDTLCTDDIKYQAFRKQVRSPGWQQHFLQKPLTTRKEMIAQLRAQSDAQKGNKSDEIMDVSDTAVREILREYHYPRLIHGHTHRPAHHEYEIDGHICERWVLSDWYNHAEYLQCDEQGCQPVRIFRPS